MADADFYSIGTVDVTNGSTAVTGHGVLWLNVIAGDHLQVGGLNVPIDSVSNVSGSIVLKYGWPGSTLSGATYVISRDSFTRRDNVEMQALLRQFNALLAGQTLIIQVPAGETAPDPGLGEDGQLATQIVTGTWKFWLRVAGVWVLQGNPIGVTWQGAWNSVTGYLVGDIVGRNGSAYISKLTGTNHDPVSSPTYWDLFTVGGTVYDIPIWDSGRPSASELLLRLEFSRTVVFGTNFTGSQASAGTAATGSSVYSIQKNGVQVGTITFAPAGTVGTFSGAAVTLNSTDVLSIVAPASRDATLANVSFTLSGTR